MAPEGPPVIFLTLSFLLYFAPALLATSRRNPNAAAIWLTNLFVGWTVIGWIITLVWALGSPAPPPLAYVVPAGAASSPYASPAPYATGPVPTGASPTWSAVHTGSAPGDFATAADQPRTCVACGRPMPPDARFCPSCGSVESRLG